MAPTILEAFQRMPARKTHREPDADGFWVEAGGAAAETVALAHRRLAIIDVSEHGRQLMHDPATGNVICFNGDVYNFRKARITRRGAATGRRRVGMSDGRPASPPVVF